MISIAPLTVLENKVLPRQMRASVVDVILLVMVSMVPLLLIIALVIVFSIVLENEVLARQMRASVGPGRR